MLQITDVNRYSSYLNASSTRPTEYLRQQESGIVNLINKSDFGHYTLEQLMDALIAVQDVLMNREG